MFDLSVPFDFAKNLVSSVIIRLLFLLSLKRYMIFGCQLLLFKLLLTVQKISLLIVVG